MRVQFQAYTRDRLRDEEATLSLEDNPGTVACDIVLQSRGRTYRRTLAYQDMRVKGWVEILADALGAMIEEANEVAS